MPQKTLENFDIATAEQEQRRFFYALFGTAAPVLEFNLSPYRKKAREGTSAVFSDPWKWRAKPSRNGLYAANSAVQEQGAGVIELVRRRPLSEGGSKTGETYTFRGRLDAPELYFRVVPFRFGEGGSKKSRALPCAVIFTELDKRGLTDEDWALLEELNATVIESGGVAEDRKPKVHIYIPLDVPHPPAVIENACRLLRDKLGGDKFDLTTFLRVPGTYHRKDKNNPRPVRVLRYSSRSRLVSLSKLCQALGTDAQSIAAHESAQSARQSSTDALRASDALKPKTTNNRAERALRDANSRYESGNQDDRDGVLWGLYKDLARSHTVKGIPGPGVTDGRHILWYALRCDAAKHDDDWVAKDVDRFLRSKAYADLLDRADGTSAGVAEESDQDVPHPPEPERRKKAQVKKRAESAGEPVTSGRRLILTPASTFKARRTLWLWDTTGPGQTPTSQGRIPMGALTIGAGAPGIAKSQGAIWLVAGVTTGTLPGEFFGKPRSVIYCATEDSWEQTIVPRLMAAGADMSRVFHVTVSEDDHPQARLSLPGDVNALGEACDEHGVALIIADPLVSFLSDSIDEYREREVRSALEPLMAMADRHIVTVYGLAHFTKNGGSDPLSRIHGSGAFGRVVRAAIAFTKTEDGGFVMSQVKNNLGRTDMPSYSYTVQDATVYDEDGEPIYTSRFVLGDESDTDVVKEMDNANIRSRGGKTKMQRCEEWLTKYLGERSGSVERDQVMSDAKIMGFTQSMLYKVRDAMGLTIEQSGFGKDKTSTWRL